MPKKILIVDDEPAILQILSQRLAASGYDICTASNGEEAIQKANSERPNLIVMDVLMPKLTGYEALKKIREIAEIQHIPAIIISAKGTMQEFFAGVTDVEFLKKPYDPKELVAAINHLLGNTVYAQKRGPDDPKVAVLLGVQDFVLKKIQDYLESSGFQVSRALNETDAFNTAKNIHPDVILCQFWEDEKVLDPKKLAKLLATHVIVSKTPLFVFCEQAGSIEVMKSFPTDRIISFKESTDLVQKIEESFKKLALV